MTTYQKTNDVWYVTGTHSPGRRDDGNSSRPGGVFVGGGGGGGGVRTVSGP